MQYALRVGRVGALSIYLNYTWLFAIVLGLWWLALLWLPDHLPGWRGGWYWLVAVVVLVLYMLSVMAHEAVHSIVGRTGPRTAVLYPTGAAQPFRLDMVAPGRGVFAALAAPLFNLMVGGILLLLTTGIGPGNGLTDAIKGILEPLGWLNFALGIVNLLPGIPFDGGWAISAGIYWFNGDRDSGMALARSVGGFLALALVLLGAWRGLATNSWLEALALVLVGWAANDAGNLSRGRSLLRGAFGELRTRDLMTPSRPGDQIEEDESVAALVKEHPRIGPGEPVAVLSNEGTLVGLVTLGAADRLLQGNWATTPVRSLTIPLEEARTLAPDSSLNEAIALYEQRPASVDGDEKSIAVVQDGKLVGSLSPARLNTFVGVAEEFGVEETMGREAGKPSGLLGLLGRALPPLIVIALLAILGNMALRTNPAEIRGSTDETAEAPITYSNFSPPDDAIIGIGPFTISVDMAAPSGITTATLTLDGQELPATLSGASPLTQTLSADIPGLVQGLHNVEARASLESGRSKRADWQFRVSGAGDVEGESTAQPTLEASIELPQFSGYTPGIGGRVLAGATDVPVGVTVTSTQLLGQVVVLVDGVELDARVVPVAGRDNLYRVSATAARVGAGGHAIRIQVMGGSGASASIEWMFSAIVPDASNVYFDQTGVFLSEPFLGYWNANGGLGIFGYPISDRLAETSEETGERYTAQYFERARFELHPEGGSGVILGRLGVLVHAPDAPVAPVEGGQYFSKTGHNLGGDFLAYWNANGGLAVFGYPITEEVRETNAADGKEYLVQYFERNRFELHPEADAANRVQLGLLGAEIYRQLYGTGGTP